MKEIYSRRRHLGEVRKLEECDGFSREIQERDKERRSAMNREEKEKAEDSGGRMKSRGRRVQEE